MSLSPIVLVDILGLKRLTTSFGLMTLARGVATLVGPVVGGKPNYTDHASYDIRMLTCYNTLTHSSPSASYYTAVLQLLAMKTLNTIDVNFHVHSVIDNT